MNNTAVRRRSVSSCFDICMIVVSSCSYLTSLGNMVKAAKERNVTYLSQAWAILDWAAEPTLMTFMGSMPGMSCGGGQLCRLGGVGLQCGVERGDRPT